jgi:hypothetical protein
MHERCVWTNLRKNSAETEKGGVHIVLRKNMVRIICLFYKISEEESCIVEGFLAGGLPRHQFKYFNFRKCTSRGTM